MDKIRKAFVDLSDEGVSDAIWLAAEVHRSQRDKGGQPYIFHPLRVLHAAQQVQFPLWVQAAAVLHDVLEDSELTADQLLSAGFDTRTVVLVEQLTRTPEESYEAYIERICAIQNPGTTPNYARYLKRYDVEDNLREERLSLIKGEDTKNRLIAKYWQAVRRLGKLY